MKFSSYKWPTGSLREHLELKSRNLFHVCSKHQQNSRSSCTDVTYERAGTSPSYSHFLQFDPWIHTTECTTKKTRVWWQLCGTRYDSKRNKQDPSLCPATGEPSRSLRTYMETYALVKADIWSRGVMRGEDKPTLPADRTLYRACRSLFLWLSQFRLV